MSKKPAQALENVPSNVVLEEQLRTQRRTVDFDTFDIHTKQLLGMLAEDQILVSPKYQRKFRWQPDRCSQFIESLMLGIPVPSLFMATNPDNAWEIVDGVQRLSTIAYFAGDKSIHKKLKLDEIGLKGPLVLTSLKKLTKFEGLTFDQLPKALQLHFHTRPLKVTTLNDKSDVRVRFDLFERLNTGGVSLSPQEIRDCIFQGKFADQLEIWSKNPYFAKVVRLTPSTADGRYCRGMCSSVFRIPSRLSQLCTRGEGISKQLHGECVEAI
jgi:hypothetical protein